METVTVTKSNKAVCWKNSSFWILAGLLAFFLGMFVRYGVGVYNDSEQYITMHIHREPLYPLFLAFFRLFSRSGYLTMVAVVQKPAPDAVPIGLLQAALDPLRRRECGKVPAHASSSQKTGAPERSDRGTSRIR